MKRLILIFATVSLCISVHGQSQVGIQVGLNVPTASIAIPGFVQVERDGTQKALIATLGAGVNINAQFGYSLSKNVLANIDLGYFRSFNGGFYQHIDISDAPGFQNNGARADVAFVGTFRHIAPSLLIQPHNGKSWKPFMRFGVIIGTATVEATATVTGLTGKNIVRYQRGISTGLLGGVGLSKELSPKLSLLIELTAKTVTAQPKELVNTENYGGELAPKVTFVDEVKPSSPATDQLKFTIPYSSVGLSVACVYKFGSKG